jgi:group I intron endonuclease
MRVYRIRNLINGKMYVGQTTHKYLPKYFETHVKFAMGGRPYLGYDRFIYHAIRTYGPENFVCEELATASSQEELDDLERFYIAEFKSHDPRYGYNRTFGGRRTMKPTPEYGTPYPEP